MELLSFLMHCSYFEFDGSFYHQKNGTPMGSPASVVIANLTMEHLEEQALATVSAPRLYRRFIDDIFCVIKEENIREFLDALNAVNSHIQFTLEKCSDNALPFLDVLVTVEDDGSLSTSVYRKPTHSGRYINCRSSHHPGNKSGLAKCLFSRAFRLSSSQLAAKVECNKVKRDLIRNGYTPRWVQRMYLSARDKHFDLVSNTVPQRPQATGFTFLPYIPVVSEQVGRVLDQAGVRVVFKPTRLLRDSLRARSSGDPLDKCNVVYKIPCDSCDVSYVGQTSRCLRTRLKEHSYNVKCKSHASPLVEHQNLTGHKFDIDKTVILASEPRFYRRIFRESWEIRKGSALSNRNVGQTVVPNQFLPFLTH
jgi:hypothetical protein